MKKNEQIIHLDKSVRIVIKAHGNLDLQGWDKKEISIITDLNVQKIVRSGNEFNFIFVDDCEMRVPYDSPIIIERASGNARVRELMNLVVRRVTGNLALQQLDVAEIEHVDGNCLLQDIKLKIKIGKVNGHLKGQNIRGPLTADRISGDVELPSVSAGAKIRSTGSIRLGLVTNSQEEVNLNASGKVLLTVPLDVDATFQVSTRSMKTELSIGSRTDVIKARDYETKFGEGRRKIVIEASDKVRISGEKLDETEMQELFKDLDELWEELKIQSDARREAREKEIPFGVHMVDRVAGVVDEAMESAFRNINDIPLQINIDEKTIKNAEQRLQMAVQRIEQKIRNLGFDFFEDTNPTAPTPPTPPSPPSSGETYDDVQSEVSAEDRLVIIRMLQEKKISLEEADQLLESLEKEQ
jgi:hypothetical protein